jgi:hypothetical protein
MKTSYKPLTTTVLLFSFVFSPSFAFAQEKRPRAFENKGFCSRVDTIGSKLVEQVSVKTVKVSDKRTERLAKLADDRSQRDEKRAMSWSTHDISRDVRIEALEKRADTDAKKAAVMQFETAIKSAVEKRRIAVATAVKTYRLGVDALVGGKMANIDGSSSTLKQALDTALSSAKTACVGVNPDGELIRTTFTAAIKQAHDVYKATRSEATIRSEIARLADARKRAVDTAVLQFKSDMEKAAQDLKAAFAK